MNDDIRLRMQEQPCLLADCFDHFGMAVTGIGHTNAAREVEQLPPVGGVDVWALGPFRDEIEYAPPDGRHVRKVFHI